MSSPLRTALVDAAHALEGMPWRHQGRSAADGVDCIGVVLLCARAVGLVEPGFELTGYARVPDGRTLRAELDARLTPVDWANAGPGDVLLVDWGGHPQHVGIIVPYRHGGLAMVHALGPARPSRVVESRLLPRMRVVQAYAFPAVLAEEAAAA